MTVSSREGQGPYITFSALHVFLVDKRSDATASTSLGGGAHAFVDGEIHACENGYARAEAHGGVTFNF